MLFSIHADNYIGLFSGCDSSNLLICDSSWSLLWPFFVSQDVIPPTSWCIWLKLTIALTFLGPQDVCILTSCHVSFKLTIGLTLSLSVYMFWLLDLLDSSWPSLLSFFPPLACVSSNFLTLASQWPIFVPFFLSACVPSQLFWYLFN